MKLAELFTLLISLLAVFISAVSLVRTRKANKAQLDLFERQVKLEERQAALEAQEKENAQKQEERAATPILKWRFKNQLSSPFIGFNVFVENVGGAAQNLQVISSEDHRIDFEPTDALPTGGMGEFCFHHYFECSSEPWVNPRETWNFKILYDDSLGKRRELVYEYKTETGRFKAL